MSDLKFDYLELHGWRQFKSIKIKFHPQLTIITGPNGTGKSTLLSILSRHFGYTRTYLATPIIRKSKSFFSYGLFKLLNFMEKKSSDPESVVNIGIIKYSNGNEISIQLNPQQSLNYHIVLPYQQPVNGLHIDSHRPPNVYQHIASIPTTAIDKTVLSGKLEEELRHYYIGGRTNQGTLFHIKSALISMSLFGHGNKTMDPNEELIRYFSDFEAKLHQILPKSLGFKKLKIRTPEVILETNSGDFIIDACSGGIIKLVEMTWQLFFFSKEIKNFVVTLDEPENHLHPSMQRELLSNLIKAFPQAQFVVVTHSPFMVSSVRDSSVFVLDYQKTEVMDDEFLEEKNSINNNQTLYVVRGIRTSWSSK